jgi:hypothetical protein
VPSAAVAARPRCERQTTRTQTRALNAAGGTRLGTRGVGWIDGIQKLGEGMGGGSLLPPNSSVLDALGKNDQ